MHVSQTGPMAGEIQAVGFAIGFTVLSYGCGVLSTGACAVLSPLR